MSDDTIGINPKTNKLTEIQVSDFDFEYWSELSKKDPEAFEAARKAEIDKYISGLETDVQERMHRFQWRIEMERKLSKNPLDSVARIYDMMWESLGKSMTAFDELANILSPNEKANKTKVEKEKDNVLSFERKESDVVPAE